MNRNWIEMKWLSDWTYPNNNLYFHSGHWNQDRQFLYRFFNCLIVKTKLNDQLNCCICGCLYVYGCVRACVFKCFRRHFIVYSYSSILLNESPFCLDVSFLPGLFNISTDTHWFVWGHDLLLVMPLPTFLPHNIIILCIVLYCNGMGVLFVWNNNVSRSVWKRHRLNRQQHQIGNDNISYFILVTLWSMKYSNKKWKW